MLDDLSKLDSIGGWALAVIGLVALWKRLCIVQDRTDEREREYIKASHVLAESLRELSSLLKARQ